MGQLSEDRSLAFTSASLFSLQPDPTRFKHSDVLQEDAGRSDELPPPLLHRNDPYSLGSMKPREFMNSTSATGKGTRPEGPEQIQKPER